MAKNYFCFVDGCVLDSWCNNLTTFVLTFIERKSVRQGLHKNQRLRNSFIEGEQ